jgi:hypothetical protein
MELIMRHYERASTLLTSNPTRRRLGRAALRHRRNHRVTGSASAGGARAEIWSAPLAHKVPDRLARERGLEVELTGLSRPLVVAGADFALSIRGRSPSIEDGADVDPPAQSIATTASRPFFLYTESLALPVWA